MSEEQLLIEAIEATGATNTNAVLELIINRFNAITAKRILSATVVKSRLQKLYDTFPEIAAKYESFEEFENAQKCQ